MSFAILITGLDRYKDNFIAGLVRLESYEADTVIAKSEHEALKWTFNNALEEAWKTLIAQPFYYDGRRSALSFQEQEYIEGLYFHPACHTVAGALKRYQKLVAQGRAPGKLRDTIIAFLTEAGPLGERVTALKAKIGKRPPPVTKTSIERAERDAKAKTCQICGRGILAETGRIAHHGYERPGMGWQTASCEGALELPFEVTRDVLGDHLIRVRQRLAETKVVLANTQAETVAIIWTYEDVTQRKNAWSPKVEKFASVTRETFDAVAEETKPLRSQFDRTTFDSLKTSKIARLEQEIRSTTSYIARQQARYDAWAGPTIEWKDGSWAPVVL